MFRKVIGEYRQDEVVVAHVALCSGFEDDASMSVRDGKKQFSLESHSHYE